MGWRSCAFIPMFTFLLLAIIFILIWAYTEKENRTYVQSSCTIVNYTFVINQQEPDRYKSWINIITMDGATLIYWYDTNVFDTVQKYHHYAYYYPVGMTRTCWLNSVQWVWYLGETQAFFVFFIVSASLCGVFLIGWLIGECINKRMKRKKAAEEAHQQLQEIRVARHLETNDLG